MGESEVKKIGMVRSHDVNYDGETYCRDSRQEAALSILDFITFTQKMGWREGRVEVRRLDRRLL